jgi:protocatechuate 3,4-dioxygenase beta subunit
MPRDIEILIPTAPLGRLPTCPEGAMPRRRLLKMSLALGAVALAVPMQRAFAQDAPVPAPPRRRPTPDQILGPFYPVRKPVDGGADLAHLQGRAGQAQGRIVYVMGRVLNLRGEPVPGARLEIWQANHFGRYTHPSDRNPAQLDPNFDGYGTVVSDDEGRYRVRTVKPGAYPVGGDWVRPPHVHFDVQGHINRVVTQMYFSDEETLNGKDRLLQSSWAKESLIAQVVPPSAAEEPDARLALWDIVLIQG